jgi:hypothetical protein
MREESRKKMSLAVMCNKFKELAKCANEIEDGKKIIHIHLKEIKKELVSLKKKLKKERSVLVLLLLLQLLLLPLLDTSILHHYFVS